MILRNKYYSEADKGLFITYLNQLEGIKTRIKNLHWAAPAKNIHKYLDEFLGVVSDYQDTVAETYMGILGKMDPTDIEGVLAHATNAMELIDLVYEKTAEFYEALPDETELKGIISETETFIKDCKKYKYLFSLCN